MQAEIIAYLKANKTTSIPLGVLDLARADYEKAASLMTPDDWLKRALERTR